MSEIEKIIAGAISANEPTEHREAFVEHARSIIAALTAAGYAIVKREPNEAMLIAGYDARNSARGSGVSGMTIDAQLRAQCFREDAIYRAMIAAQEWT